MSPPRKRRQRKRLRDVDNVMSVLVEGMRQTGQTCRALDSAFENGEMNAICLQKTNIGCLAEKIGKMDIEKGLTRFRNGQSLCLFVVRLLIERVSTREVP